MIELLASILTITMRAGTSLIYATVGEIYTERTGILNLGIEGIMLMGAVTAFAVSYYSGSLFLAVLAAMTVGALLASIHAFLTNTMRANQVVSGLSITIFGSGLASFLGQRLGPASNGHYLVGLVGHGYKYFQGALPVHDSWRYAGRPGRRPSLPGLYPGMGGKYYRRPGLDSYCPGYICHVEPGPRCIRRHTLWRHQCGAVPAAGCRHPYSGIISQYASLTGNNRGSGSNDLVGNPEQAHWRAGVTLQTLYA